MTKEKKQSLLEVVPTDIFRTSTKGYIFLGVYPITKEEVISLQEEIKFLEKTRIWSILTSSIVDKAKEKMFENAETFEDMTFGKAMMKNVELMRKIMSQIRSITIQEKKKTEKPVTISKPVV